MLRRKEKIELTEELNNITGKLDALEERQKNILEKSGGVVLEIDNAEVAADALDRELNIVVDSVKEIRSIAEESAEKTDIAGEKAKSLSDKIRDREAFIDGIRERSGTEKELLYSLMDEQKHSSGIAKTLREASESFESKADSILTDMDKLSDFSGSISEMSLNAAIEAGRLGEAGMDFVRTAEEIRVYSEEFEEFVGKARDNVTQLKNSFKETKESMVSLLDLMRNTSHSLTKMVSAIDADNDAFKNDKRLDENAEIKEIADTISVLSETQNGILEEQNNIMEHIEKIGNHYIEENGSLKKIRDTLMEIKEGNKEGEE